MQMVVNSIYNSNRKDNKDENTIICWGNTRAKGSEAEVWR